MGQQRRPGSERTVPAGRIRSGRALGSPLRLSVWNTDEATADTAWAAVIDEFEAVDSALSNYREDSSISGLNRRSTAPPPVSLDARLSVALALSDRAWRMTGGRFDPRVGTTLQRLGRVGPVPLATIPGDAAAASERWLRRAGRSRSMSTTEPLDLGGIGKGLALRWAWDRVTRILDGGSGALLECGGDLVGRGPGPDGASWLIAIEDPSAETRPPSTESATPVDEPWPIAVIALQRGGVCTSSTRIGRWSGADGRPVHHLIDPATQLPGGDGLLAVTVAWPDPAWAEVWTKELFLAGSDIAAMARRRDLAAWWVTVDGDLHMTPRARQVTVWP